MKTDELLKAISEKYEGLGISTDAILEGLLHSNPITYWDYIQTDALLGLQIQRTTLPDEMVFIMYHQVNELLFKMILWEIEQVAKSNTITAQTFTKHLHRVVRYFDVLTASFNVMTDGMDIDQYNKFRNTLTPASGFQSAQYRKIEFASTELINLIDIRFREKIDRNTDFNHPFEHLYWQAAGKDYKTGEKSIFLKLFEEKYKEEFTDFIRDYNEINLSKKYQELPQEIQNDKELIKAMRHYDYTVNVTWVMAHFNTANKYIGGGDDSEGTGGSHWKKYLHPKYQKRVFYPFLWSKEELENWGITELVP